MSTLAEHSPFDAVVFDWGGVITVDPDPVARRSFAAAGVDLAELRKRREVFDKDPQQTPFARLERGEIMLDDYLRLMRENMPGSEVLWDQESPHFMFSKLTVRPEVINLIAQLRRRGFATALLTNNVAEMWPLLLETTPVDDLFDVSVNSAFVGMRKPEHDIYHYTLDLLGVSAPKAVFLDDMAPNIAAAKAIGMGTVRVRRPGQAIGSLEQLLAG
ncbi:MAG: putative hydrolase of the HAD superfamily [Candidatus Poriferisodalaceae bacterium]|jgi:putative hydrolase of the HAD superfamily